ncbi:MAG: ATP synthase F0 subunit B [Alphaproteobacteria bacterium]|nr:ATP synthase F0 subunit B [Alphaproteobacteria bacterium]MCB9796335.1 ATP synthase F0 subunit B [Alphaproteobacteria bacterium]
MPLSLLLLIPYAHASSGMSLIPDPVLIGIQLIPFFAALLILNTLVFKPFIAYLEERDAATVGARHEALELQQKAEEKLAEYDKKLAEARAEVAALRSTRRDSANAEREAKLAEARAVNEAQLNDAIEIIEGERELAAQELERLSRALAADITQKVLGRDAA